MRPPVPPMPAKQFIRAENCSRCKYSNLVADNQQPPLECRRAPAVLYIPTGPGAGQMMTVFPRMPVDGWCHGWAPKFTLAGASEPIPPVAAAG